MSHRTGCGDSSLLTGSLVEKEPRLFPSVCPLEVLDSDQRSVLLHFIAELLRIAPETVQAEVVD
jgi:hypothetical protein